MKQLHFTEAILDQDNYNNTKASINKYILNNSGDVTDKNVPGDTKAKDSRKEKNSGKPSIKILGKKKIKHGKSYTYKVRGKGLKKKVKWSVNRKKLAKISKSGKLKAMRKGTVKLAVKSGKLTCSIKIKIV